MYRILPAMLLAGLTSIGLAQVTVIEGFENSEDPGNWGPSTTVNHTHNATVTGDVPTYVAADVTEGSQAGQFTATWETSGTAAAENPYIADDPLTYWAVRFNVNAPGSLNLNQIPTADGLLETDIKNNSSYQVYVALVVDSTASSQLERGPLLPIAAGTSIMYSWNFATTPPVGFDTGDGVFSGSAQRVKSLLVYSPVQPADNALSVTVDNIRNTNSPDLTPPAAPRLLSVEQGSGVGELTVTWAASTSPDVASYKVYVSDDSLFSNSAINRLSFPVAPAQTVDATQQSIMLPGNLTGQNIYVAVSAVDNASAANESELSQVFAANLEDDGSAPLDRIVMDQDRYLANDPEFESEGYFHAAVYTAQALDSLERTFDSVSDEALAAGQAELTPTEEGVVIWSNLKDGDGVPAEALTAASRAAISTFVSANGNLVVSGSGVAEAIAAQSGGAASLAATLKASLAQDTIGVSSITPSGLLSGAPAVSTGLNSTINTVAYSTTANDGVLPAGGSSPVARYVGVPATAAVAGVGFNEALVFLGFAFETAGEASGPAGSATVRQSLMAEMIAYLTGETAAADWQLFD